MFVPNEQYEFYLGPKLTRPLSLWNPLDYLRLLYWVLFFPKAIRIYILKFALPYERNNSQELFRIIRIDPIRGQLFFQSIILSIIVSILLGIGLASFDISFSWNGIVIGIIVAIFVGALSGVVIGVGEGAGINVVTSISAVLFFSLSGTLVTMYGKIIGIGILGGLAFGLIVSVGISVVWSVAEGLGLGLFLWVISIGISGIFFSSNALS